MALKNTKNTLSWEFIFEPNYRILIVDLALRILFTIPVFLDYEPFVPVVNILLQAFTTLFTIYMSRRRRGSMMSFLEMRLLSDNSGNSDNSEGFDTLNRGIGYNEIEVKLGTLPLKESGYFIFLIILIPVISAVSLFAHRNEFFELIGHRYMELIALALLFVWGGFLTFIYFYSKDLFVGTRVTKIRKNKRKLSDKRKVELLEFVGRELTMSGEVTLSEQNDFLIIDLQTKIKIFRERLENLSLEGIFLGALSFATLMQLIGTENIRGMEEMMHLSESEDFFAALLTYVFELETWFTDGGIIFVVGLAIITLGSLLASVFYIIVLIKRFSILKLIETAQLKIERANAWNIKEEEELKNNNNKKAMRFTDQIQIELASANQICRDIQSNLALTSGIRTLGIFSFFIVILVSADLLHHYLFVFAFVVALYGTMASFLMSNSFSYRFSLFFWNKGKEDDNHFEFKLSRRR